MKLTLLQRLDPIIVRVALEEPGNLGDELGNVFVEDGGHGVSDNVCGWTERGERNVVWWSDL